MVEYVKEMSWKRFLQRTKDFRYPALILGLGLLLLLMPLGKEEKETGSSESNGTEFDLAAFTEEVEAVLSQVEGAGELKLLLMPHTDGQKSYLAHWQQREDQSSSEYVLRDGTDGDEPIPVGYEFPTFRGAVVVCQGADRPAVTLALKEALSALVGLGMDKITVLKMR